MPEDSSTRLKAELQTDLAGHEAPTDTIEALCPPAQMDMHPVTGQDAPAGTAMHLDLGLDRPLRLHYSQRRCHGACD